MSFTPSDDMQMPTEDNIGGATITFESTNDSKKDIKKFRFVGLGYKLCSKTYSCIFGSAALRF